MAKGRRRDNMKFYITATSVLSYAENILEEYPQIKKFDYSIDNSRRVISDLYVDISSIEELLEFQKEVNHEIIVAGKEIEIYDTWRE